MFRKFEIDLHVRSISRTRHQVFAAKPQIGSQKRVNYQSKAPKSGDRALVGLGRHLRLVEALLARIEKRREQVKVIVGKKLTTLVRKWKLAARICFRKFEICLHVRQISGSGHQQQAPKRRGRGAGSSWAAPRLLEAAKDWWRLRRQKEDPGSGDGWQY